jgi:hypothetical protein
VLRLIADENIESAIVQGIRRRLPDVDLVTVAEEQMRGIGDPALLAWAAAQERVLVTHDRTTMTRYARERVQAGLPMPGVFILPDDLSIGRAIEEIVIVADCSEPEEWTGRIEFLPL